MGVQQGARLTLTVWRRPKHDMAQVYACVLEMIPGKCKGIMLRNNYVLE